MISWSGEKNDIYSTKLGYIEWMRACGKAYIEPIIEGRRWRWVWGMDITPEVKVFMWRVMKGILPTTLNLITRFVNVEPECRRCGEQIESTEHALRDCPRLLVSSEFSN